MASLLSVNVVQNPEGTVFNPAQQYLLGFGNVIRITAATAQQKAQNSLANSQVLMSRAKNNSREDVTYLVSDQVTALAAL